MVEVGNLIEFYLDGEWYRGWVEKVEPDIGDVNIYVDSMCGVPLSVVHDQMRVLLKRRLQCGEAYCEECGDCIACYGEDPCINGGSHVWVPVREE